MTDAVLTLVTKARNNGQPLTGDQIDGNWNALMAFDRRVQGRQPEFRG